jgi:hypothetical protein
VFLVADDILNGPRNLLFPGVAPHCAIILAANVTGKIQAAIGMYEHLEALPEFASDQRRQFVYLHVGLMHIEIPGYSKVGIKVQH